MVQSEMIMMDLDSNQNSRDSGPPPPRKKKSIDICFCTTIKENLASRRRVAKTDVVRWNFIIPVAIALFVN